MSIKSGKPVHMLVLHDTQNDAEPLINHFRSNGIAARSHFIASDDEMTKMLEAQGWDLVIAKLETETVNVPHCTQEVVRLGLDIPVILLVEEFDLDKSIQGFRLGAKDVIPDGEPDLLVPVAIREMASLESRRLLRDAQINLKESEKRVQLLLRNSKDAIAYVHEGMHIYANQSYLELFGYEDIDDLLSVPIMDMVEPDKQSELKLKLKNKGGDNQTMTCKVLDEKENDMAVRMDFSPATYDGEPCVQIIIAKQVSGNNEELERKLRDVSSKDMLTGFYNRQYFLSHLDTAYQKAVQKRQKSLVLYFQIQDLKEIRASLGIAGSDTLLTDVAKMVSEIVNDSSIMLARIADDAFALWIPDPDLSKALKIADDLGKGASDFLEEIEGITVQIHCNIGLAHLDETLANGQVALTQAHQASEDAQQTGNSYKYFDKSDLKNIADDNKVGRIEHALENDGFRLLFQPIISLRGDTSEHYEVFCRLTAKDGEEESILDFLAAAYQAELGGSVDRWVVSHALKDLSSHRKNGAGTKLFINLTPASISDPAFLPWVNSQLKELKIPGEAIVFQINENDALHFLKPAKAFSKGLSVLKSSMSVNQFGRIADSFSLTKHLDIEFIKVHSDIVEAMESEEGQAVLEELIKNIQSHEIASIVPQIESAAVMPLLWQAGANYIQGFLLQEPSKDMNYDFTEE